MIKITKRKNKKKGPLFNVEVVYIGESIDLKKAQEVLKQYSCLNRDHPLVLRLLDNQFAVLTKFGAVSFWNVGEKLKKQFLSELSVCAKNVREYYPYKEKTKVATAFEVERVTFNKIYLNEINLEKMRIISYVLSQSVALERYENEIEVNINDLGMIIENLKTKGRPLLKERELLKQVGRVFSVKQVAVAHLSLFDKPDEIWELPELELLYNRLRKEYEIDDRFDVLDEKINFLSENAKMLMDFLAEKRNAFLELIIIILIAIDIIPLFFNFVKYLLIINFAK
jgi:uncharacterized Rmd1/YagE family protein